MRDHNESSIRRIIPDGSVPLPKSWSGIVALDTKKADIAGFLPDKLLLGSPIGQIVIVGGGFDVEDAVKCS